MTTTENPPESPRGGLAERVTRNVRAEIGRAGLGTAELATALDVGDATVRRKLKGHRAWTFDELDSLAELIRRGRPQFDPHAFTQP